MARILLRVKSVACCWDLLAMADRSTASILAVDVARNSKSSRIKLTSGARKAERVAFRLDLPRRFLVRLRCKIVFQPDRLPSERSQHTEHHSGLAVSRSQSYRASRAAASIPSPDFFGQRFYCR